MSTGPTSAPQYKPGDVVNGHVLTDQGQWVPTGQSPPGPAQYHGQPGQFRAQPGQPQPYGAQPGPGQYGATATQGLKPKKPLWKRWWFILIAAIVLIVVFANLGGGGDAPAGEEEPAAIEEPAEEAPAEDDAAAEAEAAAQAEQDAAEAAEAAAAAAVIGTPVRDGKFEFVVTGVERVGTIIGEGFTEETAQGEYIIVRVNITNIGDEPQMLSTTGQVLYNDKAQKYEPSSDALFSLEGASDFYLEDINPGNSIVGAPLLFDVPPGTVLDKIELHDSMFSGGVDVSLVGS